MYLIYIHTHTPEKYRRGGRHAVAHTDTYYMYIHITYIIHIYHIIDKHYDIHVYIHMYIYIQYTHTHTHTHTREKYRWTTCGCAYRYILHIHSQMTAINDIYIYMYTFMYIYTNIYLKSTEEVDDMRMRTPIQRVLFHFNVPIELYCIFQFFKFLQHIQSCVS